MEQGESFSGCILITDWETKTLDDSITLRDRNSCGCCPAGTVPGNWLIDQYQGAQVVCGVDSTDGSVSRNLGNCDGCTYQSCYIYKQDLDCADGTKQRLNGCCANGGSTDTARLDFQADLSCLGYTQSQNNIHGDAAEYCTTYRTNYGACGNKGTSVETDDVTGTGNDNMLVPANLYEYTRCAVGTGDPSCPGAASSGSGTSGSSPDNVDNGAKRMGFQLSFAGLLANMVF